MIKKALLFVLIFNTICLADKYETYDQVSDYGVYGMVALPFAYSLIEKDPHMLLSSTIAHGTNFAFTSIAKLVTDRERPDKSNKNSFWSGHTSAAFTSSGIICRFSRKSCIPSLGLAAGIATLRVLSLKHHFTDVLVGGYVGFLNGTATPTIVLYF